MSNFNFAPYRDSLVNGEGEPIKGSSLSLFDRLTSLAAYLWDNTSDGRAKHFDYSRGQIELIADATGVTLDSRDMIEEIIVAKNVAWWTDTKHDDARKEVDLLIERLPSFLVEGDARAILAAITVEGDDLDGAVMTTQDMRVLLYQSDEYLGMFVPSDLGWEYIGKKRGRAGRILESSGVKVWRINKPAG